MEISKNSAKLSPCVPMSPNVKVRVTNMFEKAEYKKPIFQGLISRVTLDIETRGQVFCVALVPVTICIPMGTIGLLYLYYNTG